MIELRERRLNVDGKALPSGDIEILKHLLNENKATAFRLMTLTGKMYVQYIQYRLRVLAMLGIIVKPERGIYEINPEFKEELERLIKEVV